MGIDTSAGGLVARTCVLMSFDDCVLFIEACDRAISSLWGD